MSAGKFTRTTYETDAGNLAPIQVQPETVTLVIGSTTNDPPSGQPDAGFPSARVTGGRNKIGINARLVRFVFTQTVPPGYDPAGVLTLPILQKSVFDGISRNQTGTYSPDGSSYNIQVIGKTAENLR